MDDGPKTHLAARLTEAVETEAPAEEKVVAPVEEEAPVENPPRRRVQRRRWRAAYTKPTRTRCSV